MKTSRQKAMELVETGGSTLGRVREYLELKILEDKENLVEASPENVPGLQGRIKAYRDILADLTPAPERGKSQNPY
ncbi:hypothetical protein [Maridesulfovibrio sp. FT414]|uniref:hypothetical protein n=1 Tax=Maridesulfovibrio sp. FT414 TaxID=2979469 RepID=UPI003D80554B